jgi:hypothetical protein
MGSESLTDVQRGVLVRQIRRQLDYLNRLTTKMLRKQWPGDDPVRERGIEAQKAMQKLYDAVRFSGAKR